MPSEGAAEQGFCSGFYLSAFYRHYLKPSDSVAPSELTDPPELMELSGLLSQDDGVPPEEKISARFALLQQAADRPDQHAALAAELSFLIYSRLRLLEQALAEEAGREYCREMLAQLCGMQALQLSLAPAAEELNAWPGRHFGCYEWLTAIACALLQHDDRLTLALMRYLPGDAPVSPDKEGLVTALKRVLKQAEQGIKPADNRSAEAGFNQGMIQPLLALLESLFQTESAFNLAAIEALLAHQRYCLTQEGHEEFKPALWISALAAVAYRFQHHALVFKNPSLMQALIRKDFDEVFVYNEYDTSITITAYIGSDTRLKLPDAINGKPVTHLGARAFYEKGLTQICLPAQLEYIGRAAFAHNQLHELVLPDSLREIGQDAFYSNALVQLVIPQAVAHLGQGAFACNQLEQLDIAAPLPLIPDYCFSKNCLTQLRLPDSVHTLGVSSFSHNAFVDLSVPEQVHSIGPQAFSNLDKLCHVQLPERFLSRTENIFYQSSLDNTRFTAV